MSIATLKRKSSRFIHPVSNTHFSLSGIHRNVRPFNNTNLSSLSSTCHLDSNSNGNTVKNTSGYLSAGRNPICLYGQSINSDFLSDLYTFKSNSPNDTSQSSYIDTRRRCVTLNNPYKSIVNKCITCIYRIGSRIIYRSNITDPPTIKALTNSSSNYISNDIGSKKCLPHASSNIILIPNGSCG